MSELKRRGFLGAILAAGVAPAIIRPGLLMPVRKTTAIDARPIDAYGLTIYDREGNVIFSAGSIEFSSGGIAIFDSNGAARVRLGSL